MLAYIGAEENASSVVAFQPAILNGIGYTATAAQIHSIPVYVVAFVFSLTGAYFSERLRQRYIFAMLGVLISFVGLTIEIAQPHEPGVRYLGMFFLTAGVYLLMPVLVVWLAINVGKGYKRTVALGLAIPLGNCGAIISSNVFITGEAPRYHTGFSVGLGMIWMSGAAVTALYILFQIENRRRERAVDRHSHHQLSIEDLGDKHPEFRYQL